MTDKLQSLMNQQIRALDENRFTEADRLERAIRREKKEQEPKEFVYMCQDCGEPYSSPSEQQHIFLCPSCTDACVGY
jgi:rubrerythrin